MTRPIILTTIVFATLVLGGCVCCHDPLPNACESCIDPICDPCSGMVAQIEYPDVERCDQSLTLGSGPPRALSDGMPTDFWDVTLDEAIRIALQNSRVLKALGGQVLTSPQSAQSIYDPSISMSDPGTGEEAALAAFDAQYQNSFIFNTANQPFNNVTAGGGSTVVSSDGFNSTGQFSKISATGTQFSLSRVLRYENSDAPFNTFPSVYTGSIQAIVRHPLLQGSGVLFNRIAGPNSQVRLGNTRGVILARINGDISIAQFERGVRDFVRDVETAYWRLYTAYRSLDALRAGRDSSRTTWQTVKARYEAELRGGEADQEAQSREQLYDFEKRVLAALNGGSSGSPGLFQAERQLRRMMGLSVSDERLLRPIDEPIDTPVTYDWHDCLTDSLVRRVELREQMWRVKQRELELIAAKNFLLPRLDAVASYRIDGFGDNLIGDGANFDALSRELFSFEFNQVQAGLQLSMPLGFRRELAGVRHAKLNLCRERAVLQDQEHQVSHDLGDAFVAVETAFESIQLDRERLTAAEQVVGARHALFEAGKVAIDVLLESQRRLVDAQVSYFQTRVQHSIAIRNLHFEKGTLLPFNGVRLQEGPWPSEACEQAWYERRRWMSETHCEKQTVPCPVSLGPFATEIGMATNFSSHPTAEELQLTEPVIDELERLPLVELQGPWVEGDDRFETTLPIEAVDASTKPWPDVSAEPEALEILPTPTLNQPAIDENGNPFIDAPGSGISDPATPDPAKLNSVDATVINDSHVEAVTYLKGLLDVGPAVKAE